MFHLRGHTLCLMFYPQGYNNTPNHTNKCALFLQSKEAGRVSFTLALSNGPEMVHTEFFRESGSWGSATLYDIPKAAQFALSVSITAVDEPAASRASAWALGSKLQEKQAEIAAQQEAKRAADAEIA